MKTNTEGLTQVQHLYDHYTRLIEATKEEIIELRKKNVHFSKVDDALTYLNYLHRSRVPYQTNRETAQHLKILSD